MPHDQFSRDKDNALHDKGRDKRPLSNSPQTHAALCWPIAFHSAAVAILPKASSFQVSKYRCAQLIHFKL
jgi:hypothetical protein